MTIFHEGYALKLFIAKQPKSGYSVNRIADVLGLSRQGVNSLYGQEKIDADYVEKLRAAGIEIPGVTTPAQASNIGNYQLNEPATAYGAEQTAALRQRVKDLEENARLNRQLIAVYEAQIKQWEGYVKQLWNNYSVAPDDRLPLYFFDGETLPEDGQG